MGAKVLKLHGAHLVGVTDECDPPMVKRQQVLGGLDGPAVVVVEEAGRCQTVRATVDENCRKCGPPSAVGSDDPARLGRG
jgi:hypothetical protein